MNKRTTIILLILIILVTLFIVEGRKSTVKAPMACTEELKQCPDGSYVGRTGSQCRFAACPETTPAVTVTPPPSPAQQQGVVKGRVGVSPVCGGPERNPPDPNCQFGPYQTTISFTNASGRVFTTTSNSSGNYSISLASGTYSVKAKGGNQYPSCPTESVTVRLAQTTSKDITCDSGIR